MRLQEKSLSKLRLVDILRKKKKQLRTYLMETGIVTYERLLRSCDSIGVTPPSEKEFMNAMGNPLTPEFSSPTDGVLVLNPPESNLGTLNEVEMLDQNAEGDLETVIEQHVASPSSKIRTKKKQ